MLKSIYKTVNMNNNLSLEKRMKHDSKRWKMKNNTCSSLDSESGSKRQKWLTERDGWLVATWEGWVAGGYTRGMGSCKAKLLARLLVTASSLGSNPDNTISLKNLKWATKTKDWSSYSSPPKKEAYSPQGWRPLMETGRPKKYRIFYPYIQIFISFPLAILVNFVIKTWT